MSHRIQVNYLDPAKPKGVVGGNPTVALNDTFHFHSADGPMKVQFVDAPHLMLPDNTDYTAAKAGTFNFRCILTINGKEVVLDPDNATGGQLKVSGA